MQENNPNPYTKGAFAKKKGESAHNYTVSQSIDSKENAEHNHALM